MKRVTFPLLCVCACLSGGCETLSLPASSPLAALSQRLGQIGRTAEAPVPKTSPEEAKPGWHPTGAIFHGKASWYSIRTNGGTRTASGERLNEQADTAAHKTLPMGTHVKVTNLVNGREAVVRINDRGPYIQGRIIDVTIGVAHDLNFVHRGVVPVTVEVLKPPPPPRT